MADWMDEYRALLKVRPITREAVDVVIATVNEHCLRALKAPELTDFITDGRDVIEARARELHNARVDAAIRRSGLEP